MDPEINELKELVRQNIALSQETNKIVHKMRNAVRWSGVFKLLWIGALVAFSFGAYVYLAPYLGQLTAFYQSAQEAIDQAKQLGTQFQQR